MLLVKAENNEIKIVKGNIDEVLDAVSEFLKADGKNFLGYGIHDKVSVMYDNDGVNLIYTTIHSIPVYHAPSKGGTIVAQEGDFSFICICSKKPKRCLSSLWEDYIKERSTAPISNDRNDLLVDSGDGKLFKLSGSNFYRLDDGRYVDVFHLGIETDLKIIKNICIKKMVKEPHSIKEFDNTMTSEHVLALFEEFLREQGIL